MPRIEARGPTWYARDEWLAWRNDEIKNMWNSDIRTSEIAYHWGLSVGYIYVIVNNPNSNYVRPKNVPHRKRKR